MTGPHRFLALVAAVIALGASAPSGGGVVPADRCGDFFLVRVRIGGADRDLRMLVDTSSPESIVDPDALEGLLAEPLRRGFQTELPEAAAGPWELDGLKARVRDLDHARYTVGTKIDGILGWPDLVDVLLTVDYPRSEVRIESGVLPRPDGETVFPLRGRGAPEMAVQFGGRDTLSVVLDTGSVAPLVARHGAELGPWETEPIYIGLRLSPRQVERWEAGRLAGQVPFGPVVLDRPVVSLTDGEDLAGTDVLRNFALTFDLRNRAVRIVRPARKPIRFEPVRSTGLLLGPRQGEYQVVGVLDGTPAEGLAERGDVVLAVDGESVAEDRCGSDRRRRRKHVYTLQDGDSTRELRLPEVVLVP